MSLTVALQGAARGIRPGAPSPESDQSRSHRLFAENYSTVAATADLGTVSLGPLELAESYASQVRANELRKGWGGDTAAVNRVLVESLDRELEHLRFELKKRYAARDARALAATQEGTLHEHAARENNRFVAA